MLEDTQHDDKALSCGLPTTNVMSHCSLQVQVSTSPFALSNSTARLLVASLSICSQQLNCCVAARDSFWHRAGALVRLVTRTIRANLCIECLCVLILGLYTGTVTLLLEYGRSAQDADFFRASANATSSWAIVSQGRFSFTFQPSPHNIVCLAHVT